MNESQTLSMTDIFESGKEGYVQYRIPGIVITKKGTVIVYCEARDAANDWANIDIYMRRSFDSGKTWENRKLLIKGTDKGITTNNPCMIASKNSDTLHLLFCRDYATAFYCCSTDEGETWTEPVEITSTFDKFKNEYPWEVIATGPCHGIEAENGRLIVPVWLALEKSHHPSVVSTIYSDDKGATWNRGELILSTEELVNPNETAVVELSDGRIMLNMRNVSGIKRRSITTSENGYDGWSKPVFDEYLIDPVCCGGLAGNKSINYGGKKYIIFSNCNSETERKALTIRVSRDDGKTWAMSKLIYSGGSAYSDIAIANDGTIYCCFERYSETERYKYLTVAKLDIKDFESYK